MPRNTELHTSLQDELLSCTAAMPHDTNSDQDIFGGRIISQMGLGGGILTAGITQGHIIAVAVQEMNFTRPVRIGNIVCYYSRRMHVGDASLQLKIEAWVGTLMNDHLAGNCQLVTKVVFTYAAVDAEGNTWSVPKEGNPKLAGLL